MAIKKSELYSSLWASCDQLRGSMDASQYKDYVLVLLFMKYVSDKKDRRVEIPKGGSFEDMKALKRKKNIGEKINTIIGEFAKKNDLKNIIDVADFDSDEKLGKGQEKIDKLSNLISIFERPELDFSANRAENDDLLGDAYEYLMKHFATESGKSKGQFYTPSEVSRIMAKVIGINKSKSQKETLYDPTCGSGSLLLKAASEAPYGITIYGQENDNATRGLAVMNMWLHGVLDATIEQGNTLANPAFTDEKTGNLRRFNYAVANPPFSNKNWTNGLKPEEDIYERFSGYNATPPEKNGDYAFLLHLIRSLDKQNGKACIVMPLGVLFRGNSEAEIRKVLINRRIIKGIIGLPPNLFYGTGIAACLVVIDMEDSADRNSLFMIDASKSFIKDGNKNRLREQDIHKIVDTFNNRIEIPKYSRAIPLDEIKGPKNDCNLNIPRYIDSQDEEDIQDIEAHLKGGLPKRDIDALEKYWAVYPSLRKILFQPIKGRTDYYELKIPNEEIKDTIYSHPEYITFSREMENLFNKWKSKTISHAKQFDKGLHPKNEINAISENLLKYYSDKPLVDKYDIYQHLMDYWNEIMLDDMYEIAADGWKAGNEVKRLVRIVKNKKTGKEVMKNIEGIEGLEGRLIPPSLLIDEFFADKKAQIENLEAETDAICSEMDTLLEEHGGEDGLLNNAVDEKGKINKKSLQTAIKELGRLNNDNAEEYNMLEKYKKLMESEAEKKNAAAKIRTELETAVIKKYPALSIDEIKIIVIEKKWMRELETRISSEMDRISRNLTARITELARRYETPLPQITARVEELTKKVEKHLQEMNFKW